MKKKLEACNAPSSASTRRRSAPIPVPSSQRGAWPFKPSHERITTVIDEELSTGATGHARCLRLIRTNAGICMLEIAKLLDVRRETVSRWQGKARPHPHLARRLFELASIVEKLAAFHGPEEARRWLYSPQSRLGEAPAQLIKEGRFKEVSALVDELCTDGERMAGSRGWSMGEGELGT